MLVRSVGRDQRPWNKGLLIRQKRSLQSKHVWSISVRLEIARSWRDLVIFNLAIDSKLRACDLVKQTSNDNAVACNQPIVLFEADRSTAAAELLRAAVEGKEYWSGIFAEYDRRGIDRPDPVPHPDDVVIDYETGEVRIKGPVMTEQKDARETAILDRKEYELDLEICIKAMEADPNNLELRRTHKELTKIVGWLRKGAPSAG